LTNHVNFEFFEIKQKNMDIYVVCGDNINRVLYSRAFYCVIGIFFSGTLTKSNEPGFFVLEGLDRSSHIEES